MKLQQLFSKDILNQIKSLDFSIPEKYSEIEITSITSDSRTCHQRSVFVAIQGTKFDSHQNIPDAIRAGALVLVVEKLVNIPPGFLGWVVQVASTRGVVSKLAAALYDEPSKKMICFAVTGTNGKTSMTYLIEHLLQQLGQSVGVIGTINHRVGSSLSNQNIWSTELTTPDPATLQKRLFDFVQAGAKYMAMEVSSHALDQDRATDVHFDVAIFTNLTHDHLDYHGSMEKYFESKQKLFTELLWQSRKIPKFAVVNFDDKWGRKLRVADSSMIWTYGRSSEADFSYQIQKTTIEGTEFLLSVRGEKFLLRSPLVGDHNVSNVVAAIAATSCVGLPIRNAIGALELFPGIPGRLQRVVGVHRHIFVDYAHTPDALENTLKTVAGLKGSNKLITVFGCGGDRDKTKRPLMAEVAKKYSDEVIVTSDNPRTEDPKKIIEEIMMGFRSKETVQIEMDRRLAIHAAIQIAGPSDIVVIAGKGHEDYQIIGTEKTPFSDYKIAELAAKN